MFMPRIFGPRAIFSKIMFLFLLVFISFFMINGAPIAHAQSTFPVPPPPTSQIIQQPGTTGGIFQPGTGFFPSQTTTFPPSVFPPTTSALPSTSFGTQTGSLSPWFPSLPAIGCGGTFSLTIVGDVSSTSGQTSSSSPQNNNNNNDNGGGHHGKNGKNTLALQVNSAGGVDLTQQSVKGRFFVGQHNIDNNQANNFDIKDVFNNCQVITFSR
jgi:hypothetical protein